MEQQRSATGPAALHLLEEQWPQGIVITDASLRIEVWNQWMVETTDIATSDAVGRSILDVVPSLIERGFDAFYQAALVGQPKVVSYAFHRFIVPSGTRRAEQMPQAGRIVPLRKGDGIVGTLTVVDDVS